MQDSNPLVSIGMPVYNGAKHLRQALDSLLAQDYENIEIIISDNASTDTTADICNAYLSRNKRIRYSRNAENIGPEPNFNRVFQMASGDYFMWAAHDDYWKPEYVRLCMAALRQSNKIILAGAVCELVDGETGQSILIDRGVTSVELAPAQRYKIYKSTIHKGKHIGGIYYGIYRRRVLNKVMPTRNMIAGDHLLLAELCLRGEFITVPETLMFKRWGGSSRSYKDIAAVLGIKNPFFIRFPMFVREIMLQKIIFQSDQLGRMEKIRLAAWSILNYLQIHPKGFLRSLPLVPRIYHVVKNMSSRAQNCLTSRN